MLFILFPLRKQRLFPWLSHRMFVYFFSLSFLPQGSLTLPRPSWMCLTGCQSSNLVPWMHPSLSLGIKSVNCETSFFTTIFSGFTLYQTGGRNSSEIKVCVPVCVLAKTEPGVGCQVLFLALLLTSWVVASSSVHSSAT